MVWPTLGIKVVSLVFKHGMSCILAWFGYALVTFVCLKRGGFCHRAIETEVGGVMDLGF